jgi:hypothetical protein
VTNGEIENAKAFIEDMCNRIINEELPVIAQHQLKLQKVIRDSNERIQREAIGQEQLLLEHSRIIYRQLNFFYQLLNSKVLMKLLENNHDADIT